MKYYIYCDPAIGSSDPIYTILSDKAILAEYWHYWSERMQKVGALDLDNIPLMEEQCIEDYCVVHWAVECTPEHLKSIFEDGQ